MGIMFTDDPRYFYVIDSSTGAERGHFYWGDHLGVKPVNYIETGEFVFDAEELVRALLECGFEPTSTSLTHYLCCASTERGLETGPILGALQWDSQGDPYILRLAGISFTRTDLARFVEWFQNLPTWKKETYRGMEITEDERERWKRLAERFGDKK